MPPISCVLLLAVCFAVNVYYPDAQIDERPSCPLLGNSDFDEIARRVNTGSKPSVCVDYKTKLDNLLAKYSSFCLSKGNKFICAIYNNLPEAEKRGGENVCSSKIGQLCTKTAKKCERDWAAKKGATEVCYKLYKEDLPLWLPDVVDIGLFYKPDSKTKCPVGKKNIETLFDKVTHAKKIPKCRKGEETPFLGDEEDDDYGDSDYEKNDDSFLVPEEKVKKPPKAKKVKKKAKQLLKEVPKPKLPKPVASVKTKFQTKIKNPSSESYSSLESDQSSSDRGALTPSSTSQNNNYYVSLAEGAEGIQKEIRNKLHATIVNDVRPKVTVQAGSIGIVEGDLVVFDGRKKRGHREHHRKLLALSYLRKIGKRLLQAEETQQAAPSLEFSFTVQYPLAEASKRDLRSEVKSVVETASDTFESKVIPGLGIDKNSIKVNKVRLLGADQSAADDGTEDSIIKFLFIGGAFVIGVIVVVMVGALLVQRTNRRRQAVQMQNSRGYAQQFGATSRHWTRNQRV